MNIDIPGISELKWTKMGKFNSDDHYIYFCGQKSLKRNGEVIIKKKKKEREREYEIQYLDALSKMTE